MQQRSQSNSASDPRGGRRAYPAARPFATTVAPNSSRRLHRKSCVTPDCSTASTSRTSRPARRGGVREKYLPPVESRLLHVANVRANKMTDHRLGNAPHQVRRENKRAFQHDHHVHSAPREIARDGAAHLRDAGRQLRRGIQHLELGLQNSSSAITRPVRVPDRGANSSATGHPRAQTSAPALVSTGQPARSLEEYAIPGTIASACERGDAGEDDRNHPDASSEGSVASGVCRNRVYSYFIIVSRDAEGQSMTFKLNRRPISGTTIQAGSERLGQGNGVFELWAGGAFRADLFSSRRPLKRAKTRAGRTRAPRGLREVRSARHSEISWPDGARPRRAGRSVAGGCRAIRE